MKPVESLITERLIDYALGCTHEQLTQKAVGVQRRCVGDTLACMLAAAGLDETGKNVARYAAGMPGKCTMLAQSGGVCVESAALANGALTHALDFDDSHDALVHPSSVTFPALLALAEELGSVSGRDFLTALVVGTDVSCRLAMGPNEDLMKYGWNSPPLMESMGALFGAANLLRLTHDELLDAIAMLMTQFTCSAEAMLSRGSVIRTMREGFAAQAVVRSALMSRYGVRARFETPLEGKYGFYAMYARGNYDPERIVKDLGERFETENITFKPWPSCKHTHTSIQALEDVMTQEHLAADDIEEVHISLYEASLMTLEPFESKCRPESPSIAKSSMPFVLGTVMARGGVGLESFLPERLGDAEIYENAKKVSYEVNPALTKAQNQWIDMTVTTKKGTFFRHLETSVGGTGCPMSEEQTRAKFFSCCRLYHDGASDAAIEELYCAAEHLDELENACRLLDIIRKI